MRGVLPTICLLIVASFGCGTEPSDPNAESKTSGATKTNDATKANDTTKANDASKNVQPANVPLPEIRYYELSKG